MTATQLSFWDASAAKQYEEEQLDAFLLKVIGPRAYQKRKRKEADIMAIVDEACRTPLRPDLAAWIEGKQRQAQATPRFGEEIALLGLEHNASKQEITRAYRRKARTMHPDKGGSNEAFKALKDAYHTLLNR